MRFLKNRKFAWAVLAVCVLSSVFLLGGGALRNERYDVMMVYVEGTDTSLSTLHSMDAYLNRAADRANMLAEQATKLGADESLIQPVRDGAAAVASRGDLDARHGAYAALTPKVETLYTTLERDNAEAQLVDARLAYNDYTGAVSLIRNDQYPALAGRFNQKLRAFPANLIARLFDVEPLNTFGW